jgi:cytochrome c-type biogenesis protein
LTAQIGIAAAFGAGLLSFLSPCVLPLIPGYLSFMTGLSAQELSESERPLSRVLVPALLFVAGFTIVFVAFGASASVLGQLVLGQRVLIERVAGIALVVFGVLMLGVIRVPWLYGEARMDLQKSRGFGRGAALVMGMAFAAGWTPCVGPILGAILALAGSTANVASGAILLLVYSLGLGVPFIAVALLFGRLGGALKWVSRHTVLLNRIAGVTLILLGIVIFTGRMGALGTWLNRLLPTIGV